MVDFVLLLYLHVLLCCENARFMKTCTTLLVLFIYFTCKHLLIEKTREHLIKVLKHFFLMTMMFTNAKTTWG
jgi:hypothetical protein